jgi:hypothetical protein
LRMVAADMGTVGGNFGCYKRGHLLTVDKSLLHDRSIAEVVVAVGARMGLDIEKVQGYDFRIQELAMSVGSTKMVLGRGDVGSPY